MGTAINGIDTGFNRSMSLLGDDILYVSKHPWASDRDDWAVAQPARYKKRRGRPSPDDHRRLAWFTTTQGRADLHHVQERRARRLPGKQRVHARHDRRIRRTSTPSTYAKAVSSTRRKAAAGATCVCWAATWQTHLFPEGGSVGKKVKMSNQEFTVVGVFVKQGSFLGLFSFDDQVVMPLSAFKKYFAKKGQRQRRAGEGPRQEPPRRSQGRTRRRDAPRARV